MKKNNQNLRGKTIDLSIIWGKLCLLCFMLMLFSVFYVITAGAVSA